MMSRPLIEPIEESAPADDRIHLIPPTIPKPPFFCSIVAPRQSGKTTVLINLLTKDHFYRRYFDLVLVFSASIETDYKWKHPIVKEMEHSKRAPKLFTFSFFSEEMLNTILDAIKKENMGDKEKKEPPLGLKVLLVFDDMITEGICSNTHIGPVERAAIRLRHIGISTIIVSQKYNMISKKTRENSCNWIFFDLSKEEMTQVARERCGNMDPQHFYRMLKHAVSEPFSCVHVNDQVRDFKHKFIRNFDTFLVPAQQASYSEEEKSDQDL